MSLIDIIIPTMDNWQYLGPLLQSIECHRSTPGLARMIVVNNGHPKSIPDFVKKDPELTILEPGKNLGWEGGLKFGVQHSKSEFVVFMNDDTYVPLSSSAWLLQLMENFEDPKVAAAGPSSNCVMGLQNIFVPSLGHVTVDVNFLIGFCVMLRRSHYDSIGGIDDSMPNHGDDLDLGIRFRKAGYRLVCDRRAFIYHHGFKTGQREHGSEWNSVEMTERTNHYLIKKHGLKDFVKYILNPVAGNSMKYIPEDDTEGDIVRKYAEGNILEVGCGGQKTVPGSIGVDIIPKGHYIPGLINVVSVADYTADLRHDLPIESNKFDTLIARHILEHLIDPVRAIRDWGRIVKDGGKLIIAVPDEEKRRTIPMNYQHVHAFNRKSLRNLMETLGFKTVDILDPNNYISFVGIFEKNGISK